jgi:hypothetical protein
MNLVQYTSTQLVPVPELLEPIEDIDQKTIITKNYYYCDYYTSGGAGNVGKVTLQNSEKLASIGKKGKIIKVHKY